MASTMHWRHIMNKTLLYPQTSCCVPLRPRAPPARGQSLPLLSLPYFLDLLLYSCQPTKLHGHRAHHSCPPEAKAPAYGLGTPLVFSCAVPSLPLPLPSDIRQGGRYLAHP